MIRKHRTFHTHALPGKRLRVRLRDGTVFVDKLVDYPKGKVHEFVERGKVKSSLIEKVELYSKAREINIALTRINRQR